jgi:hypothetical protein
MFDVPIATAEQSLVYISEHILVPLRTTAWSVYVMMM